MSKFNAIYLLFLTLILAGSISTALADRNPAGPEDSSASLQKYRGWRLIAEQLLRDGIKQEEVNLVFENPELPAFGFIPFKLKPVESFRIYDGMTATKRVDKAEQALKDYKMIFLDAERKLGVTKYVIAAIISVETNWGSVLGDQSVLYRLCRIASTADEYNIRLNFRKHHLENPSVTFKQTEDRARYLFNTFYPQIRALFQIYQNNPAEMLKLKGSVAGAFGLPQFLPQSYLDYAQDGNHDKKIDLFMPEDAIISVANFLKSNGWKRLLPSQEKLKVLWNYNRSEAYGLAIIKVALSLQNRELGLNYAK